MRYAPDGARYILLPQNAIYSAARNVDYSCLLLVASCQLKTPRVLIVYQRAGRKMKERGTPP
jgi:hypothetical protein